MGAATGSWGGFGRQAPLGWAWIAMASTALAAPQVVIKKDHSGHFRVAGAVNDARAYFLVDTGATNTTVTPAVARQAGLTRQPCRWVQALTANGVTEGCQYWGKIAIGPIVVSGEINVLPRVSENLLGMNVLRGLHITQSGLYLTMTQGNPTPSSISITPAKGAR